MYALIKNDAVEKYPYSFTDLRRDNPNTSFPKVINQATMESFGAMLVFNTTHPSITDQQVLVEGTPVFSNNRWEEVWTVRDKTAEEIAADQQRIQTEIVQATQARLDDFARTRGYDSILSACTYATSPTAKFATEGQYCVQQRDATWAKLYQILTEVEAGTRPIPTWEEVEAELPALVWPAN